MRYPTFGKTFAAFVSAIALSAGLAVAAHAQISPPPGVPTSFPAPGGFSNVEEIRAFSAHVEVRADGTIDVTERIDYNFPAPKHGIYRDIPIRYVIDGKKLIEMPVTVHGVQKLQGGPWTYVTEENRDSIRIKIGDADRTLTGVQSYVISYSVSGALRYFDDHDELYWNATGTGWEVPIRRANVSVSLPEAVDTDKVTVKCYTGPKGSTAQNCLANVDGATANFVANDALTVVVGWNKGVVKALLPKTIGPLEKYGAFWPFLLPILAFFLLYRLWDKHGRDPEGQGTIVVQYDAPPGMTPAEVGTIYDQDADNTDVSSIIVDLAIRGYLRIDEVEKQGLLFKSKDYEFHRLKEFAQDKSLAEFEKHVLTTLFGGNGVMVSVSDMAERHLFYAQMQPIKNKIYEKLVADGYFPSNPATVRASYLGAGIVVVAVALAFGGGGAFTGSVRGNLMWAAGICGAMLMFFSRFMSRRTLKGVQAYDHAAGFRDYLMTAEKYRLQWQEGENVFEKFLPYAMAFGVVDKWSKAFEGMNLPPMNWYHGSMGSVNAINAMSFYNAIDAMNTAVSAAMISAPSSSSGGSGFSGGSSGGGGGGGGGGSW